MTAFMVSLAGVPPTGGFFGKLGIFAAAIDRGGIGDWLAIAMVINSVISVGYYFLIPAGDDLRGAARGRGANLDARAARRGDRVALALILAIFVYPNSCIGLASCPRSPSVPSCPAAQPGDSPSPTVPGEHRSAGNR